MYYLTIIFFCLLFVSNMANAAAAAESGIEVDFSSQALVTPQYKKDMLKEGETLPSTCITPEELSEKLMGLGISDAKKINIFKLSHTELDDETFAELTERLIGSTSFEGESAFDLSFNNLKPKSAAQILKWVGKVKFINLHGNPRCSMRYIADLCKAFEGLFTAAEFGDADCKKKVRDVMGHIVFLPAYYIYQAKTRVKIYKQLQEQGYLPADWDEVQKKYYRLIAGGKAVYFSEDTFPTDPELNVSLT